MSIPNRAWLATLCGTLAVLSPTDPVSAFLSTAPGAALAIEAGNGGKARINLSGKLRTLSQRIAAAACNIGARVDQDAARTKLRLAQGDFRKILDALENGDTVLGVPNPETAPKALAAISRLRRAWEPVDGAVSALLEGDGIKASAAVIRAENLDLLDAADIVASLMTGQYSDPATLSQADAMAIGIAGRQRMFSQMLDKQACELNTGQGDAAGFAETAETFEASLTALRDGRPDAGVRVPPNEGIRDELDKAWTHWRQAKPVLEKLAAEGTGSEAEIEELNGITDALLIEMDNIVTRYLIATPGSEDVYRVPLRGFAETELAAWLQEPVVIEALRAQNAGNIGTIQAEIDTLDAQWRAETKMAIHPLIDDLMGRPASLWLQQKQAETAGFVTEAFVMDNVGLNVAQSAVTSDYWQGDEAKWQQTFGNGSGEIHISEVEFDDSTQVYQAQVSMPIFDPDTRELIGAVTFGVNVQSLL